MIVDLIGVKNFISSFEIFKLQQYQYAFILVYKLQSCTSILKTRIKKIEKKNVIIEYRNKININIMFFPLTSKGRKCRTNSVQSTNSHDYNLLLINEICKQIKKQYKALNN